MKESKSKPTNTVSARKHNSVIELNSNRVLVSLMNTNVKKENTSKKESQPEDGQAGSKIHILKSGSSLHLLRSKPMVSNLYSQSNLLR